MLDTHPLLYNSSVTTHIHQPMLLFCSTSFKSGIPKAYCPSHSIHSESKIMTVGELGLFQWLRTIIAMAKNI